MVVFGQHNQVIAAVVAHLLHLIFLSAVGHIHLAAENGLKGRQSLFLALFVHPVADVVKLFDAKHVAVVGDGHATHAIGGGFLNKFLNARLSVEY